MNYSEFITRVLTKSSQIANDNFGKVSSTTKEGDNNQVLTQTDIAIGVFITEEIKKNYPSHNIIDEEAGAINNNSQFTWVVDPIDGTSNFASGLPMYGVMLGLLDNATPLAGGIVLPFFNDLCVAEKGKGAYHDDKKLSVTHETDLLKVLVGYCIDGHQENPEQTKNEAKILGEIVLNIRNLRTSNSAFDVVMLAEGKYGGLLNQTSKIWDNVAQQIIVEEAGGIYTDFFGKPIDYSLPLTKATQNFTFCAGAPQLHTKLQEIIHAKLA